MYKEVEFMQLKNRIEEVNQYWTDIYYLLHYAHEENISQDWLLNHSTVADKLGNGIHNYFGNPDCSVDICIQDTGGPTVESTSTPRVESTNIGFDVNEVGTPSPKLAKALETLLNGTLSNEPSLFSDKTAGMLNGVSITKEGVAIVDFTDFSKLIPQATTSAGRIQLFKELNSVVFQFANVKQVYYQFDGSFSDFCYWLEIVEEPFTKAENEKVFGLANHYYI
jgi:hypothetical protein